MNNSIADNVVSFHDRPKSCLSTQLLESNEAYDLAPFLYAADQRLGRADMAVPFTDLVFEERERYVSRASIAIRLGDPLKAQVVNEHAALALIKDVTDRIQGGTLRAGEPEAAIDLRQWRRLAVVAMVRGLDYLAGVPRINVTDGRC